MAAILLTNSVILNWCVARGEFDLLAQARETLMVLFCPAALQPRREGAGARTKPGRPERLSCPRP